MDAEQVIQPKKEPKPMTAIKILEQLLEGRHLNPDELKTAKTIMLILKAEIESRTEKETK